MRHPLSSFNPGCPSNTMSYGRINRAFYHLARGVGWVRNIDYTRLGIGWNLIDPGYILDRFIESEDRA